ncbi:MAG: DUF309 domain-containing protein [Verrucomicrobiales bacterium]|jgi:hypothetical protein|nr:DUF309 domain-containing protein [Verrucomicrobiales bacterium]
MSGKSGKIEALIAKYQSFGWRANYLCYFDLFNRQEYYDAHDVLEELWLKDGKLSINFAFYKGLIQCTGAFVHMQKHYAEPLHRAHSQRLRPAYRLLRLCWQNMQFYPDIHEQLDLRDVRRLCVFYGHELQKSQYRENPWSPIGAPQLHLLAK